MIGFIYLSVIIVLLRFNCGDTNPVHHHYRNPIKNKHLNNDTVSTIKCNYRHNPCDISNGHRCDLHLGHCICLEGHVQLKNGKCLPIKSLGEECIITDQCQHQKHSICMAIDDRLVKWRCQCKRGFWYDADAGLCKSKLHFNNRCTDNIQCNNELICSKGMNSESTCQCPHNYRYNGTTKQCIPITETHCQLGQQWNDATKKCEEMQQNDNGGINIKTTPTSTNSKLLRSLTPPGVTVNRDAENDEKILEIILEISFLIVCLLAYQVCSKACCPEDNDDDIDVKSDEESMISTRFARNPITVKKHRKARKVFCKSRTNSTQKLVPSPVMSNNNNNNHNNNNNQRLKDVIVNFEDKNNTAVSQCYNCRIYQDTNQLADSPNARCKMCRDGKDHSASCDDTLLLLPMPPYRPIRRSEEIGVPPHLRAPYINNQPFWLK